MIMNKKHYDVVAAVIEKDGKIFCCQRGPKGECAYKWEFPGGKIEPGETSEQALIREINEELKCTIKVNRFIATINHEYNEFTITMSIYLCSLTDGVPVLLEHKNSVWCGIDELYKIDFAAADLKVIKKVKKLKDALDNIDELKKALRDVPYFNSNNERIFNKVYGNIDYAKYISIKKKKQYMDGNTPFKLLAYAQKKAVFKMLIESIDLFIISDINEKKENS